MHHGGRSFSDCLSAGGFGSASSGKSPPRQGGATNLRKACFQQYDIIIEFDPNIEQNVRWSQNGTPSEADYNTEAPDSDDAPLPHIGLKESRSSNQPYFSQSGWFKGKSCSEERSWEQSRGRSWSRDSNWQYGACETYAPLHATRERSKLQKEKCVGISLRTSL